MFLCAMESSLSIVAFVLHHENRDVVGLRRALCKRPHPFLDRIGEAVYSVARIAFHDFPQPRFFE
jgi:hypothetical protein